MASWIYSRNPIGMTCVKKIEGRYMLDLYALKTYIEKATLENNN